MGKFICLVLFLFIFATLHAQRKDTANWLIRCLNSGSVVYLNQGDFASFVFKNNESFRKYKLDSNRVYLFQYVNDESVICKAGGESKAIRLADIRSVKVYSRAVFDDHYGLNFEKKGLTLLGWRIYFIAMMIVLGLLVISFIIKIPLYLIKYLAVPVLLSALIGAIISVAGIFQNTAEERSDITGLKPPVIIRLDDPECHCTTAVHP